MKIKSKNTLVKLRSIDNESEPLDLIGDGKNATYKTQTLKTLTSSLLKSSLNFSPRQCRESRQSNRRWCRAPESARRGWWSTPDTTCWDVLPPFWRRSSWTARKWWLLDAKRFVYQVDSSGRKWSTWGSWGREWTPSLLMAPFTSVLLLKSSGAPFVGMTTSSNFVDFCFLFQFIFIGFDRSLTDCVFVKFSCVEGIKLDNFLFCLDWLLNLMWLFFIGLVKFS